MVKDRIVSVFVPFERFPDGSCKKRDDLPRFLTPGGVRNYIRDNSDALSKWMLEWQETSDKKLIDEYVDGVGTANYRRPS